MLTTLACREILDNNRNLSSFNFCYFPNKEQVKAILIITNLQQLKGNIIQNQFTIDLTRLGIMIIQMVLMIL